jgi:hypothetical protein
MAAKGKTSPALVGFLIFFVLTTIILGVTTYLGFSGQDELSKAKKAADDEKTKLDKDRDWERFLAVTYKSYAGFKLDGDDMEAVGPERRDFAAGTLITNARAKDKEDDAKNVRDLDQKYGWNEAEKRAAKSMQGHMEQLTKERDAATKNWEAAKAAQDKGQKDLDAARKEAEADRTAYADNLKKQKGTFDQDLAKYLDNIASLQKQIDDLGKDKEALKAAADTQQGEMEKKLKKSEKDRKAAVANEEKFRQKVAPVNILDYDHPKGKIMALDRDGRMPFINLGSADHVRPQLTFSVYGIGPGGRPVSYDIIGSDGKAVLGQDGKPEKEGKATIEVVSILGEHLSQARVTSVRDSSRDPIVRGDLLFNPAWSPSERQHVAITGLVDLSGDGHDDLPEFLRTLQSQGVVVDQYLDLKDLTKKGPGIDRQTDYLILGTVPTFPGQDTARDDDPRVKRRSAVIKDMGEMQDEATRNGVTIISLRKFLALTGYHVPRAVGNAAASQYGSGAPAYYQKDTDAPEGRKPAAKKPADEKKDEDKDNKDKDKEK